MERNNDPLVSIRVITYNSSEYIIEALESVKAQSYKNIELVISDDCSTDNTVSLCQDWIRNNKRRFIRVELITHNVNTGIGSNMNRATKACRGDWIKGLAGDDKLVPEAIEKIINFSNNHNDIEVIFGNAYGIDSQSNIYRNYLPKIQGSLTYENFINGKIIYNVTTVAFKKEIIEKVGFYEEGVLTEDIYFSRKIWKHCKVGYCDAYITMYRIHDKNTSKNTWIMYLESKEALKKLIKDSSYKNKQAREYLNFFVLLSDEYKMESMKYLLPSLRFFYDRLFYIGLYRLISLNKVFKLIK